MASYKVGEATNVVGTDQITCDNCPIKGDCVFDRKRPPDAAATFRGGFKGPGNRPQTVIYRLITDGAEGRRSKEDTTTCINWNETLRARARHARLMREEGKDAEILVLIGNEGDTYKTRETVFVNGQGQIIKAPAELVPYIKEAGLAYNPNDLNPSPLTKNIVLEKKAKPFSHSVSSDYDQEMYQAEADRRRRESEAEERAIDELASEPLPENGEAPKRKGNNQWGRAGKPKDRLEFKDDDMEKAE